MAAVDVLVVDDQAPFRSAARAVIGMAKGFNLIGEAESGEQAVELVEELTPGLVLMDINMGAMNGIEAARRITGSHPDVMVLLLSTYSVDDLPPGARSSGAAAYIHKEELTPRVLRHLWDEGGDAEWRSGVRNEAANPGTGPAF